MTPSIALEGPGGVKVLQRESFADARGAISELWRDEWSDALGLPRFVQHNVIRCAPGALRGLHVQNPKPQGKLITVLDGAAFDVGVDLRRGSPTFGAVFTMRLAAAESRSLFLPAGFAHGVMAVDGPALVVYQATAYHEPGADLAVRWDDSALAIDWPVRDPVLSQRDRAAPLLAEIPADRLPAY